MEDYEVVINFLKDILGDDYTTKKLYVEDYGKGTIYYGERDWGNGDGSVHLLGRKNDLKKFNDKKTIDVFNILKLINKTYEKGHSLVVGSDLYYGQVLELDTPKRLNIYLFLNKICCYSKEEDIRNIFKVVNSYLINYGYDKIDEMYVKKKVKKIC